MVSNSVLSYHIFIFRGGETNMFDILFKNTWIADGSGEPMYRASVGVKDGKIAMIGDLEDNARLILEGDEEHVLCPGFFDVHTHNDLLAYIDPDMAPQVLQGVTFDICGNCGQSAYPVSNDPEKRELLRRYTGNLAPVDMVPEWPEMTSFKAYKDIINSKHPKITQGCWIGQGTVRIAVMGMENRMATPLELEKMKAIVREAMENGCLGMSTGLIYAPGVFTPEEEIIELAKVVGEYGGIYASHMRNESSRVVEAVEEAIRIAKAGGCKLLISHHKVIGKKNAELCHKTLALMDQARADGMTVMADQYLFNYGSTMLSALFPPEYQSEGVDALIGMLRDEETCNEICSNMETDESWENFFFISGPEGILVVSCAVTTQFNNMNLTEIAEALGISPAQAAAKLMMENNGSVLMAVRLSDDSVIETIWKHPFTAAGSDGIGAGWLDYTHPRAYCAYVHIFEEFVRNRKIVSLEEAVRKCTSLPAGFVGFGSKGWVKEGYDADLVWFNKETIGSSASFAKPRVAPRGVDCVLVGGKVIVADGKIAD